MWTLTLFMKKIYIPLKNDKISQTSLSHQISAVSLFKCELIFKVYSLMQSLCEFAILKKI